jgi:hypothetical protein
VRVPQRAGTPAMAGDQIAPAFFARQQAAASQGAPAAAPSTRGSEGSELPAGAAVVKGEEAEVEMEDFQFRPKVLVIKPGTAVKFANKDQHGTRQPRIRTSLTAAICPRARSVLLRAPSRAPIPATASRTVPRVGLAWLPPSPSSLGPWPSAGVLRRSTLERPAEDTIVTQQSRQRLPNLGVCRKLSRQADAHRSGNCPVPGRAAGRRRYLGIDLGYSGAGAPARRPLRRLCLCALGRFAVRRAWPAPGAAGIRRNYWQLHRLWRWYGVAECR